MGYFRKKFALRGTREKSETESSNSSPRPSTLYIDSQIESSVSHPQISSRPTFGRASSAPVATRHMLAAEQSGLLGIPTPSLAPPPTYSTPATQAQPVERPIILRMTKGPTVLRSVLPKRAPEPVRPKTSRKSLDAPPQFGYRPAPFTTSVSMPAISDMVSSASATSITIIPPSPTSATPDAPVNDFNTSAPAPDRHHSSSTSLLAATPVLEQEITFPSHHVAALPSPSSESGGELFTPSPSLGCFSLPEFPVRRPIVDSCIPEETASDGSPTSIISRMERESAAIVMVTGRLVSIPSRAVLREFNPERPITLDLSSATRKPNHMRQVSAGPSIIASSSDAPMSPNYARPLPLSPPSTPEAHFRSRMQRLEVDVEEEITEQTTPPSRGNPFQDVLDFIAKQAQEEGVDFGVDASAVGAAH